MSSSDSPSPLSLIRESRTYDSITDLAVSGVGGFLLAIFLSLIAGVQEVVDFLLLPFEIFTRVAIESANAFFIEPLGLTRFGTLVSAGALPDFGIAALPVSVIVVLVAFGIVVAFLAIGITSNFLPGVAVDNPIWDFFFGTPEEEAEGDD